MDKLDPKTDGASPDLRQQTLEQLRELLPEVFTEGKVDWDALRDTLGDAVDDREERYGLTWNGKAQARRIAQQPSTGTLRPCPEESVNWETTQNLFIEGDNLEVLKLLQKSYHRKVKMIYIDPPYNTGKEFIYPDRYQDNLDTYLKYTGQVDDEGFKLTANPETSGRYHTNWLNMMYPRLKLARNLLRDDGVIFVSIDDNEVHNLRHLMDDVFGEENFVCMISWQRKYGASNNAKGVAPMIDYLLAFSRTEEFKPGMFPREEEARARYQNPDGDPRGPWKPVDYWNQASPSQRPNLAYDIMNPNTGEVIRPSKKAWKYSRERYEEQAADDRIYWGVDGRNSVPALKRFLSEVRDGVVPTNFWDFRFAGHTDEAKKETEKRVGPGAFLTPKPVKLVKRMVQLAGCESKDLIMDFFCGSGTTGDALLQMSQEDGDTYRFILVQLPEPTDSSHHTTLADVAKDRLRSASASTEESRESSTKESQTFGHSGFRTFQLADSNFRAWEPTSTSLEVDLFAQSEHIKPDRSEQDVVFEVLLKYGIDLVSPIEERSIAHAKVYLIGDGALVLCLDQNITLEVVDGIAALKAELQPEVMRVVFRDAGFTDDVVKTNAVQILRQAAITDVKSL